VAIEVGFGEPVMVEPPPDIELSPDIEVVALRLALGFMQSAFADLATAWSRSEPVGADAMVREIERRISDGLTRLCDDLPANVRDRKICSYAALGLHNAMLFAKSHMRGAATPH
jgi:hypothetical protein